MKDFNKYYIDHKTVVVPGALVVFALLMIVFVVLPQFSSISTTLSDNAQKQQQIVQLTSSLTNVQNANDNQVNEDLGVTTAALPASKDVVLIFNALSSAASDAGVGLVDFSLKAGGIFGRAAAIDATGGVSGVPEIEVQTQIAGDASGIANFTKAIQQKLPLSEVEQVTSDGQATDIKISFFYKPIDTAVSQTSLVAPLSQNDLNLINQLKSWQQ